MVVVDYRKNQIAHIQAHAGERYGADDNADDNAADTDGDSSLGALDNGVKNLLRRHACFLTQPAGSDGRKDGDNCRVERRIAHEHERNQQHERNHQMALLLDNLHRVRNVFLR